MPEQGYVFGATGDELESERLRLLEQLYAAPTQRLITEATSLDGARVLEIGAGHGGVAMWLADQVGPSGHVVATDIDTRFLEHLDHPRLEVRQHDIVSDPLDGPFDLIHGRLVLHHVFRSADAVLGKLIGALRPGGCLAVEEPDVGTSRAADSDHPRAARWARVFTNSSQGLRDAGIMDNEFGRRVPELFRTSELVDVRSGATYDIAAPGSDYVRWNELTCISGRAGFASVPGVTLDDVDELIEALRDPTFHVGEMAMVRVVGYRR